MRMPLLRRPASFTGARVGSAVVGKATDMQYRPAPCRSSRLISSTSCCGSVQADDAEIPGG